MTLVEKRVLIRLETTRSTARCKRWRSAGRRRWRGAARRWSTGVATTCGTRRATARRRPKREARRRRRRLGRNDALHKEGLSSDDEQAQCHVTSFDAEKGIFIDFFFFIDFGWV